MTQAKQITVYEAPKKASDHHIFRRFCKKWFPNHDTETDMRVRRVNRGDAEGEHVQIEIMISQYKGEQRREYKTFGYIQLDPAQAIVLAEALLASPATITKPIGAGATGQSAAA